MRSHLVRFGACALLFLVPAVAGGQNVEQMGEPLVRPVRDPAAEPTWDIEVRSYENQDRVAHYVEMFTGRAKERIRERLERGTRYEGMIRSQLRAGGVPEDMYYLALVESGFDNHAYSRAAAVGMWQFMAGTARDVGLRVDSWVDERRDPVRSTGAAVRYLRELRDQFGSLYLAAAAYNGGTGRVSRGVTRFADDIADPKGDDAFFVLADKDYLKNETREYVPQLIAAALIAKEPVRYGMELKPREPFAYDSVSVPGATPLAAAARAAGVPTSAITDLNPHLLRGMTPPRDRYVLRIPVGMAAGFDSAFGALPARDRSGLSNVTTKKGDTPMRVADKAGIPVAMLRAFNPSMKTAKSGRLVPGQVLVVPTAAVASAALAVPEPSIRKAVPAAKGRVTKHARGKHASVKPAKKQSKKAAATSRGKPPQKVHAAKKTPRKRQG